MKSQIEAPSKILFLPVRQFLEYAERVTYSSSMSETDLVGLTKDQIISDSRKSFERISEIDSIEKFNAWSADFAFGCMSLYMYASRN